MKTGQIFFTVWTTIKRLKNNKKRVTRMRGRRDIKKAQGEEGKQKQTEQKYFVKHKK